MNHDAEFHERGVDRVAASLDDVDVILTDRFEDSDRCFANRVACYPRFRDWETDSGRWKVRWETRREREDVSNVRHRRTSSRKKMVQTHRSAMSCVSSGWLVPTKVLLVKTLEHRLSHEPEKILILDPPSMFWGEEERRYNGAR